MPTSAARTWPISSSLMVWAHARIDALDHVASEPPQHSRGVLHALQRNTRIDVATAQENMRPASPRTRRVSSGPMRPALRPMTAPYRRALRAANSRAALREAEQGQPLRAEPLAVEFLDKLFDSSPIDQNEPQLSRALSRKERVGIPAPTGPLRGAR